MSNRASEKQIKYAQDIAEELGIDMPDERSISSISEFIDENKNEFYQSRRERMGGYAEMYDRIDHYSLD